MALATEKKYGSAEAPLCALILLPCLKWTPAPDDGVDKGRLSGVWKVCHGACHLSSKGQKARG